MAKKKMSLLTMASFPMLMFLTPLKSILLKILNPRILKIRRRGRLEELEDEAGALREMQAKVEQEIDADVSDTAEIDAAEDPKSQKLEDTKKRLEELEDEAGALREMQAKVEQEMGVSQVAAGTNKAASSGTSLKTRKTRKLEDETENVAQSTSANPTQAEKEEVDARSIYVGNEEIDPAVRVQAAPPAVVGFVPHRPWICTLCRRCKDDRDVLEMHIQDRHRNCSLCPTVSCSTVYRTGAAHICVNAYVLYQGDYIRVDVGEEGN